MKDQTIDILIPVFKTDNLAECLKSVVNQTELGRIIILNNTGKDAIYEITSSFDREIKIIQPAKILPTVTACLVLTEAAEAEWVRFLSDDDILTDNSLSLLKEIAISFENISMSFSAMNVLKPDGYKKLTTYDFPEYINGTDYLFNIYQEVPFTTLSNAIIRRSSLKEISRLLPDNLMSVCGLFAMHAMCCGSLTYINKPTVTVRQPERRIIPAAVAENDLYHIIEPLNYYLSKKPDDTKRVKWLRIKLMASLVDKHCTEYLYRGRYTEFLSLMRGLFSLNPQAGLFSLLDIDLYRTFFHRIFYRIRK